MSKELQDDGRRSKLFEAIYRPYARENVASRNG
jgi:hypothetical protein